MKSYVEGQWLGITGKGHSLVNPTNGQVVASCSTEGLDFGRARTFAGRLEDPLSGS